MLSGDEVQEVIGADAYSSDGERIGSVSQVFLDDVTGEPVFATVDTGLSGGGESFIPLANASVAQGRLDVGFDKSRVDGAPAVDADDNHLSPDEERALYDYYGIAYEGDGDALYDADTVTSESTYERDSGDNSMIRSEEQLRVSKTREVAGRVRLRKYVVTENVTVTVPVRKEKAVVEAVPVGEAVDEADQGIIEGAQLSEGSEIVLNEEVPVVETVVRPVERVRLGTEEVTEMETVTEEVRQERIAVEGDVVDGELGSESDR
jgi:uncharacterized protein (TIGR02271 family)